MYRNVDTTAPFGTAGTWTGASTGTFATAPTLTTTAPDRRVLAIQAVRTLRDVPDFANPTGTALSDVTEMFNPNPGNNSVSGRVGTIAMAAAGATGDATISHVSKFLRLGMQVPLRPATASGSGQVTLAWDASGVPNWADGYELVRTRSGITEATVTIAGAATQTYPDTTVGNGTFTYGLCATYQQWRSATVTVNITRSC